jgi:predicted ABC-type sugar transport system permease subunit
MSVLPWVAIAWALLALPAALLLGRGLRVIDRCETAVQDPPIPVVVSTHDFFAARRAPLKR